MKDSENSGEVNKSKYRDGKGHWLPGNPGKPKGTISRFTAFKNDLIGMLESRRDELGDVDFKELLKAWVSLMPKDIRSENITQYVTMTPRPTVDTTSRSTETKPIEDAIPIDEPKDAEQQLREIQERNEDRKKLDGTR